MPDRLSAERDMTTIVLVGAFNPRIFQPAWFVAQGLIPPEEGTSAEIRFINNDVCSFETDWCSVEVLGDRAIFKTTVAPVAEVLRDLVIGTFRILRHSSIVRLGLNTHAQFSLPNEPSWLRFGHLMVPKERFWDPVLSEPGTLSLTIQGKRPDDYEGHVQVRVGSVASLANGIFIDTNDEYRKLDATTADWVVDIIRDEWDDYRRRATTIRNHLLDVGLEES